MSDAVVERVTRMVAPLVADLKLDLYDLEYRGGVLRITVDTPPGSSGGVDLDTIALLTRMIGRDFEAGLANVKTRAESGASPH